MKKIELRPEWILKKYPHTVYPDGKGNVTIYSDSVSDAHWIDLALDTLEIKYESEEYFYEDDQQELYFEFQWEFRIKDIMEECPSLHKEWEFLDATHDLPF